MRGTKAINKILRRAYIAVRSPAVAIEESQIDRRAGKGEADDDQAMIRQLMWPQKPYLCINQKHKIYGQTY